MSIVDEIFFKGDLWIYSITALRSIVFIKPSETLSIIVKEFSGDGDIKLVASGDF